ncbi:hypothetical protein BDAP_000419 [Binucleata daphniae]
MSTNQNLKNYKYNAVDTSFLSNYILNPYYEFVTSIVPLSIAPNTLTLLGLLCSLLSLTITLVTDPTLCNQNKQYIKLLNAFLLFAYQTFDAIDGKQARRTNSSSALGQLFDHGCDAFSCFSTAITVSSSLGLGTSSYFTLFLFSFISIYYFCALEEYFCHRFYLGFINGPSEGIFAGILAHLTSYFYGTDVFRFLKYCYSITYKTNTYKIYFYHIFLVLFILSSFLVSILNIMRSTQVKKNLLSSLINMHTLFMSYIIYTQVTLVKENTFVFYIVLLNFFFVFAKETFDISVAHLKKEDLKKIDVNFNIFIYSGLLSFIFNFEYYFYLILCVSACVGYFDRVITVINEFCEILNIKVFSIQKLKEE